jgi:hypothetical protein
MSNSKLICLEINGNQVSTTVIGCEKITRDSTCAPTEEKEKEKERLKKKIVVLGCPENQMEPA